MQPLLGTKVLGLRVQLSFLVRAVLLLLLVAAPSTIGQTCAAVVYFAHTFMSLLVMPLDQASEWHLVASQLIAHGSQVLLRSDTECRRALCFCLESRNVMIGSSMYRASCKERSSHIVHAHVVS